MGILYIVEEHFPPSENSAISGVLQSVSVPDASMLVRNLHSGKATGMYEIWLKTSKALDKVGGCEVNTPLQSCMEIWGSALGLPNWDGGAYFY